MHAMVAGDASDARQGKRAGERVGKMEELTTNPFVRSIWAEEDRGSGSTKKGGARTVLPWRSTVEGRFRPGKARARLMEVWRRCEEWLGGLSWKGSMNGSRRWPGRRRERARLSWSRGGGGGNERGRVRERVYNAWKQQKDQNMRYKVPGPEYPGSPGSRILD